MMKRIQGYWTDKEQAHRLGVTVRCLQLWRKRGIGPRWTKAGISVLYPIGADGEWLKANEQEPERAA